MSEQTKLLKNSCRCVDATKKLLVEGALGNGMDAVPFYFDLQGALSPEKRKNGQFYFTTFVDRVVIGYHGAVETDVKETYGK